MLEQLPQQNLPAQLEEKSSIIKALKPKTAFLLGLIGGVLVLCTIGFFILLVIMLTNDSSISKVNTNSNTPGNLNVNSNQQPSFGKPADVAKDDQQQGEENAKVVMIEYSDFQCSFCQKHHETMKKIMTDFSGQVQWVYRHYPLKQIHPLANKAALASECAAEQGKFWEYGDKLFENQSQLTDNYFTNLAQELKLKMDQFNSCLASGKYQSKVDAQLQDGIQAGVKGTPGTFINGQLVPGAVPYEQFKSAVGNALK